MNLFQRLFNAFRFQPQKTVMIIDDSDLDRTFVRRVLSSRYKVIAATCGQEGIRMAVEQKPDLILLDYMMPDMNGPDVCRRLKSDPITQEIPIVFLTSVDGLDSMGEVFDEGADNYLLKPIRGFDLLSQVKVSLHRPNFSN